MNTSLIFFYGMIGALAPEIVRLYSIRRYPKKFRWSWFYLLISLLFSSLGGVIALILPTTTYWGSFYVGVCTPMLINKILEKGVDITANEVKSSDNKYTPFSYFKSFLHGL